MFIKRIFILFAILAALTCAYGWSDEIDDLQVSENLVQLDGSASSDEDGDNLRYYWRQVAGPSIKLLNASTARPSFYATIPGRYTFELVVSDGKAKSEPALVNVEVERINHSPIAIMPKSISGKINDNILLDASASNDSDGDAMTYYWYQISGPKLLFRSKTTDTPFLNMAFQDEGVYIFELVTSDGTLKSKPVRSVVKVIKPNSAPIARVIKSNQKIMIRKNNNISPEYNYSQEVKENTPPTSSIHVSRNTASVHRDNVWQNTNKTAKAVTFENFADNSLVEENPQTCKVGSNNCSTVSPAPVAASMTNLNSRYSTRTPVSTYSPQNQKKNANTLQAKPIASTSGNSTVEPGSKVIIKGFGVDPQNNNLQYQWKQTAGPKVLTSSTRSEDLYFIPKQQGIYIFELTVNNGSETSKPAACAITVARDVNGLMSLGGNKGSESAINDVEIPGIDPVAAPTRRGGLLSRFFTDKEK